MALPSLTGLQAFEVAARHMSFTLAAAELNVTQTAISHQIRRLEEQLGKPLFIRRNRTLLLTADARDYLPLIRSAFEDLRRATEKFRRSEADGVLTVSTTASLATKWLVPRVAAFQDANPGLEIRITTSASLVDFAREDVDLAVRYGRGNWPGLQAEWLMPENIFPVCSPALLTGEKPLKHPQDLVHHTLLHTMVSREDWQLWLTAAGLPLTLATRRGLTFDQSFMAIQAAVDGLGIAMGRSHLVETDIEAGRLVAPFTVVIPREAGYYIVTPRTNAHLPKIKLLIDWLKRSAQSATLSQAAL